jgi:hypothetical protein
MSEPPYPYLDIGVVVGTWDTTAIVYPDTGFEGGLMIPIGVGREIVASPGETEFLLPAKVTTDGTGRATDCFGRLLGLPAARVLN